MLLGRYHTHIRDTTSGQALLKAANHFLDRSALFEWIKSSEKPITRESIQNDFICFYKYPEKTEELNEYFSQAYHPDMSLTKVADPQRKLRMCCWEFLLLVLIKSGTVTEEEIRSMYRIQNEKLEHYATRALRDDLPFAAFETLRSGKAKQGDVLLYEHPVDLSLAAHAALYISPDAVIEMQKTTVRKGTFSGASKDRVYIVPAEMVARNVNRFIQRLLKESTGK